jgi:hypothetical protein
LLDGVGLRHYISPAFEGLVVDGTVQTQPQAENEKTIRRKGGSFLVPRGAAGFASWRPFASAAYADVEDMI